MSSKLLVTGGAGFIGSNFIHYWLGQYPDDFVLCLDALTYAGNRANLAAAEEKGNFAFFHGDIGDEALVEKIMREHEVDTIVHFAAESHVDRSILGPDAFIKTNIDGTHALLKVAKKLWLDEGFGAQHRFHHISTDEVYGTLAPNDPAFKETTPYAPNSPYAASKASSDFLVRAYHHTYGLEVTTTNCSNNYGPYHFPEKLIPLVITNVLRNKPLPIYGDGKQIRDWLYVEDHVRGIDLVLKNGKIGETYNIGGNNEWKNIDIVELICGKMNEAFKQDASRVSRFPEAKAAISNESESLIEHVEDRLGHDRRYAIDASKISSELGYDPREDFTAGIDRTVHWFLTNEAWWQTG